jgi:alkylation response protein AidB-like acyl-CoA dehydrogenase
LSEAASGSDAFALQTRARKDGDNWIINGSKMWITNSYEAEVFLIFANVSVVLFYTRGEYGLALLGRSIRAKVTRVLLVS